ncbi:hypothetical protein Scep_023436 [Stephania cephalantha]|uniref:Uncharacterized protein n=1 Tax=Stephania cephalantha TaxID=152367 RepID=A0AAP0HXA4_9MAGN
MLVRYTYPGGDGVECVTKREWYHAEVGVHELEEMVCRDVMRGLHHAEVCIQFPPVISWHVDVDMDDREAIRRYNAMTAVRRYKLGMDELCDRRGVMRRRFDVVGRK